MMRKHLNRTLSLLLALTLALSLAACGGSSSTAPTAPDASGAPALAEGGDTLTVALPAEPTTLWGSQSSNINSNNPICNIAEGLIEITPDGQYVPWLAESYEVIDDTTYRFHLKQGVKFHNGDEMKAEDVVYSLHEASISPVVTHASSGLDPEGFVIEDDYTVIVKTLGKFSPILSCLSHSANSIVSKRAAEEMGKDVFQRAPVGTGPFKFSEWISGEQITLERFDDYHAEPAKSKTLVYRVITEAASRVIELESGGVDVIGEVPMTDLQRLKETTDFTVYSKPGMRVYSVVPNQSKAPFDDLRVRQALSYATNQSDIISAVWEGSATQIYSVMPPAVMGYTDDLEHYDLNVEKAKSLLAEAGYPDGISFTLLSREDSVMVKSAEVLQSQWAKAGINITIETLDAAAWDDRISSLNFDATVCSTNNSVGDPDSNFFKMFSSTTVGIGGNYAAYKSEKADELILAGRSETDTEKRIAIYEELQRLLVTDDCVWVPIAVPDLSVATRSDVKGFELYANNTQRYRGIYK